MFLSPILTGKIYLLLSKKVYTKKTEVQIIALLLFYKNKSVLSIQVDYSINHIYHIFSRNSSIWIKGTIVLLSIKYSKCFSSLYIFFMPIYGYIGIIHIFESICLYHCHSHQYFCCFCFGNNIIRSKYLY